MWAVLCERVCVWYVCAVYICDGLCIVCCVCVVCVYAGVSKEDLVYLRSSQARTMLDDITKCIKEEVSLDHLNEKGVALVSCMY